MATGTQTMMQRVRGPGHGLIVGFPTTTTKRKTGNGQYELDTLESYFFRVAEAQRFYYEYDQLPSQADGDTTGFGYLGENGINSGDDVLRVGEDDFHAYHIGFAPESPDLNVYTSVSPSSSTNKALSRRGRDTGPSPGDGNGFFNSRRGDKYDPPASTELVAFRNDNDGEFYHFGFEATDDIAAENTTIYLVGRGYKLLPVTDSDVQDKMLDVAVAGAQENAELPTVITQVGGLGQYELGTERPDNWTSAFRRRLDYRDAGTQTPNGTQSTPTPR